MVANFLNPIYKRICYFGDQSSLHGMRYMLSVNHISCFRRLFWLVFVTISLMGMLYILKQASDLFTDKVISYVPQSAYLPWKVDFPAITVCEAPDTYKLSDHYSEQSIPTRLTALYKEIIFLDPTRYCRSCSDCENMACPEKAEDFVSIVKKYKAPCEDLLVRCSWRDQPFDCCDRFIAIKTEFGDCFVFNSAQGNNLRQHLSDRKSGAGYLKFGAMESIKIDIHSPFDVTFSHFDKHVLKGKEEDLPFGAELEVRFSIQETKNDAQVRVLKPRIRGCLFPDEFPQSASIMPYMYKNYSHSTCIVQCRALKQLKECNCTHHMLPRMGNEPLCDLKGLTCLSKLMATVKEEEDNECDCLPSCVETSYDRVFVKNKIYAQLNDELIDRGSLVSIFMDCLPSIRVERIVVRTSLDYVVFVGGTAGIFFGASILSIIEIVYLIAMRTYD